METFIDRLKNPPNDCRPLPFWSWNDKLEPDILEWQVNEMAKAGIGGYFMHARGGLQTEYMGDEWMECIRSCINEGSKTGMQSWCYDEEGWPSGFAGGIVTGLGDRFHSRYLEMEFYNRNITVLDQQLIGIYRFDAEKNSIRFLTHDAKKIGEFENDTLIVIRHKSNPYYIDVLNEEVVKAFIDSTYEKYYSLFGEEFGKGMPGFFTDEPQFAREQIPWSYILVDKFREKYGYDLTEYLPALFIDCAGYEKIRYDFWSLINELFVSAFGEQIYYWCESHNCKLTGHLLLENSLYLQMHGCAGVMTFYEYLHIPGMDWQARKIDSPVTPKQVGSVANQLGKKQALSETFASCGWDVSFEELKWIAEWQYVNGINLLCQHLEGYTLRGARKRDYPPSLFYQQSYWEEYRVFNDYISRLGMLLSEGENVVDILLIHPMKSAWIAYNKENNESLSKIDRDFLNVSELLSGLHFDYHYGDESILKKYGCVEDGFLRVGKCRYKVVILPSMITIDESTLALLNQFSMNGGTVLNMGDLPILCNGNKDEKVRLIRSKTILCSGDNKDIYSELEKVIPPNVSISNSIGEIRCIHYQQRSLGDSQMFFMVNHHTTQTYNSIIRLKGKWVVKQLCLETLEYSEIDSVQKGDYTCINLVFLPMQSHIIILDSKDAIEDKRITCCPISKEIKLNDCWAVEKMDLNSMTLDYCTYSIDNGDWQGPIPVISLQEILLKMKRACDISLKFNFEVNMNLSANKEFYIILEKADEFNIYVNGSCLLFKPEGWWKDRSFQKVNIKPHIVSGMNEIVIKRHYYQQKKVYDYLFGEKAFESERNRLTYDVELESIYLLGDFGVISKSGYTEGERKAVYTDGPFVIIDKPANVKSGDLTRQGLIFFAGKIKLTQKKIIKKDEGKRVILNLGNPDAIMSKVYVNSHLAKVLPWAPYTVDITDLVLEGANTFSIQLFAGNRNLLGPHHHAAGEFYWVGCDSFTDKGSWTEKEMGLTSDIWRDRYCFVKFGLPE